MLSIASKSPVANSGIIDFKSAPTENGASGAQNTSALKSFSAMAMAWLMLSSTARLMARILLRFSITKISPSRVKPRITSVSNTVVPKGGRVSPKSGAGRIWRRYTSSAERGSYLPVVKLRLPSLLWKASTPLSHSGKAALLMVLPASISA